MTTLLAEAQRLRAALDEAEARLAGEVAQAAHDGARALAQQAADALDARLAPLRAHLDDLVAAVQGLPAAPEDREHRRGRPGHRPAAPARRPRRCPASRRRCGRRLAKPVRTLQTLTDLASDAAGLAQMLQGLAGGQVTARLSWRPAIDPWGLPPTAPGIFVPRDPRALRVDVEVKASAGAAPEVDVLAEITDFDLNLVGDGPAGLMRLMFRRIAFHAGSTGKPEVDVVFGGIAFLGPLSFVDRLRELVPFDGFSDPPYVDVAPSGVTAGFDLALPNVAVGVFSLENIALGADARVPFLGDAMTVGFRFCSKDAPFRLTVMAVGGGGWLGLRAAPKGLVLLELGLEAAASLSVDLGVASGSVSISVGVYLRLEADTGLLTAYFRIRGEVDVLGLVSASITLELSLTYQFDTGKLVGRASLVVEVEVLFFSASVEIVRPADAGRLQGRPDDGAGHAPRRRRRERGLGGVLRRLRPGPGLSRRTPMPTTVLATALPRSLADDAEAHLTVFLTHKLVGGDVLSAFPAAVGWPTTLAGCTFALTTSLDPGGSVGAARRGRRRTRPPGPRSSRRARPSPASPPRSCRTRRGGPCPRAG